MTENISNKRVLKIEDLNKTYGSNHVLHDIDFDLYEGELVSIIGPSGAGKSTLLRCINRLVEPDEGSKIYFLDKDITKLSKKELMSARREIGMIFQHYNLVNRLTAIENVLHGKLGSYSPFRGIFSLYYQEDIDKAQSILEELGLSERKYYRCSELSGGQKQRVGIGRALIQNPKMILCDEPIASLDPQSSKVIMEHLRKISKESNIPCLINLHQVEVAKTYSDRIIGINSGKVVFRGRPEELSDEDIFKIYGASLSEILA